MRTGCGTYRIYILWMLRSVQVGAVRLKGMRGEREGDGEGARFRNINRC